MLGPPALPGLPSSVQVHAVTAWTTHSVPSCTAPQTARSSAESSPGSQRTGDKRHRGQDSRAEGALRFLASTAHSCLLSSKACTEKYIYRQLGWGSREPGLAYLAAPTWHISAGKLCPSAATGSYDYCRKALSRRAGRCSSEEAITCLKDFYNSNYAC